MPALWASTAPQTAGTLLRSAIEHKPPLHPEASATDEDAAVALLRLLEEHPEYSQRQLASALGVTLLLVMAGAIFLARRLMARGYA